MIHDALFERVTSRLYVLEGELRTIHRMLWRVLLWLVLLAVTIMLFIQAVWGQGSFNGNLFYLIAICFFLADLIHHEFGLREVVFFYRRWWLAHQEWVALQPYLDNAVDRFRDNNLTPEGVDRVIERYRRPLNEKFHLVSTLERENR